MHNMNAVSLSRPKPARALISLVPMIDVMLILLVFFMVTSTYLNLDMIPAVQRGDESETTSSPQQNQPGATVMVRIGADGVPTIRRQSYLGPELETMFTQRLIEDDAFRILILPSGAADMQALITVMDAATRAGVQNVRVVRLEASE